MSSETYMIRFRITVISSIQSTPHNRSDRSVVRVVRSSTGNVVSYVQPITKLRTYVGMVHLYQYKTMNKYEYYSKIYYN